MLKGGMSGWYGQSCRESSEKELSVLPRHTKVVVIGNNRTKSVLVGLQGVVKKVVGLGGWHWLVLTNGIEVKLQRNALGVIEAPTGHEADDENEDAADEIAGMIAEFVLSLPKSIRQVNEDSDPGLEHGQAHFQTQMDESRSNNDNFHDHNSTSTSTTMVMLLATWICVTLVMRDGGIEPGSAPWMDGWMSMLMVTWICMVALAMRGVEWMASARSVWLWLSRWLWLTHRQWAKIFTKT